MTDVIKIDDNKPLFNKKITDITIPKRKYYNKTERIIDNILGYDTSQPDDLEFDFYNLINDEKLKNIPLKRIKSIIDKKILEGRLYKVHIKRDAFNFDIIYRIKNFTDVGRVNVTRTIRLGAE